MTENQKNIVMGKYEEALERARQGKPIDEWPYEVEDNEYDGFDEGRADDRRHGL